MKKDKEQLKELLKKLQALAERGVGGEKETAKRKLDKLLKDNNMTEADLKKDKPQYYLFSYQGEAKKQLLAQCIYKTVGVGNFSVFRSKGTRNKIGTYCTPAQKIEIELDYQFYSKLFDEEVLILLEAFITKQDLFPEDVPTSGIDPLKMSEEDYKKWEKLESYKHNISKKQRQEISGFIESEVGK